MPLALGYAYTQSHYSAGVMTCIDLYYTFLDFLFQVCFILLKIKSKLRINPMYTSMRFF